MKGFIKKYGAMMAAFAMVITTMTANSACIFLTHQPKMPETAKKLRKF